jgi:hypothetical protein
MLLEDTGTPEDPDIDMHGCCALAKATAVWMSTGCRSEGLASHRWISSSDSYKASEVYEKIPA